MCFAYGLIKKQISAQWILKVICETLFLILSVIVSGIQSHIFGYHALDPHVKNINEMFV